MESIVQLKTSEYQKLLVDSKLNKQSINEKSEELYKKHGTHKIVLEVRTEQYDESIDIKASAYVRDWDSKYPLKEEDKKKIIHFVENKAEQMYRRSFGDVIHNLEKLKKKNIKLDNTIRKNLIITVTGWLLAVTMLGVAVYVA
tara:strand:- start:73 stop:501 length:429 start_codon:yes stop_codon:yes gene_type:complete